MLNNVQLLSDIIVCALTSKRIIINSNRKQVHQSHMPHYEKEIEFFVKLYSIIKKHVFLFRTTFLSSNAMWVAIDCRFKNWVKVLKSLGSTVIDYISTVKSSIKCQLVFIVL
jgi:hypothetical protein